MPNENLTQDNPVTHLEMGALPGAATNKSYKDSLFRLIYSGNDERSRRWLLSLYNAVSGRNYTDTSGMRITTIENVIYLTMKNDLSFLMDSQMNLFEHQSTVNPNMPLRGLMYFGQLYQNEVKRRKKNIYGEALIKIPSPRFIVFYNGEKSLPDVSKLKLSAAFEVPDKTGEFEWTATVININRGANESLQKKCQSLYYYTEFVARVRENQKSGMEPPESINEAVNYAIRENFLEGFFEEQKMYITNSLLTEFDQELHDQSCMELGYERGRAEGIKEGAQQNAVANAKNLLSMNLGTSEQIAQCCSLPLEQVLALKEELAVHP
ncbi:MAG: hypothetical protein J6N81_06455 [Treponema sp.]|nr:hypothetical protein [Treponema sp.]